jgi:ring-1,2-phenylacetyl-CoA epoxidase subunit PaaB
MTYEVPRTADEKDLDYGQDGRSQWPMWEVFVRQKRGLSHVHAGSLHAPDAETALQMARDVYTRRVEGISIWVVRSDQVVASDPDEADAFFEAVAKPYRQATYYQIPDEVGQM